LERSSRLSSW